MASVATFVLYIGIAAAVSICLGKACKGKHINRKLVFFLLVISSFFAACRGSAGSDSNMYRTAYEMGTDAIFRWVEFEAGYLFLMDVFRFFHLPYQCLFFFMAFLTLLFMFLPIIQEHKNIDVSFSAFLLMLDFYYFSWNAMRQALAIAMCIYAMFLWLDQKSAKAIVLILCACLFHMSAMIAFVIIFVSVLFHNRYAKFIMVGIFAVALFLVSNRNLFGKLVELITGSGYYASYITRDAYTEGSLLKYYIKAMPLLVIPILGYRRYHANPKYKVLFGLMICGYILSSLGSVTDTQVQRMGLYFTYLSPYVLGFLVTRPLPVMNKNCLSQTILKSLLVLYSIVMFVFNLFIKGFNELFPYGWFI